MRNESIQVLEEVWALRTARKPPNAPDTEAAEKKTAALIPYSERLYQLNGTLNNSPKMLGFRRTMRGSRPLQGISRPGIHLRAMSYLKGMLEMLEWQAMVTMYLTEKLFIVTDESLGSLKDDRQGQDEGRGHNPP